MRKIKDFIKGVIFRYVKPPMHMVHNSYAQVGEDMILSFLFNSLKIGSPSYIDIGANRPDISSNTYAFYLRGSGGVCIEPDKSLYNNICAVRPRDKCLNVAIGYSNIKELDFFVFNEPSVNTLSSKDAQERINGGEFTLVKTVKVKVVRLEEVIKKHFNPLPNFISLDIEGLDFEVLNRFDFENFPVPVWVVETVDYTPSYAKTKNFQIINFMLSKNYFVYADTYVNTIFVSKSWYEKFQ